MSFSIRFHSPHWNWRHRSQAADHKLHLGLELLEQRYLLSASAAGVAAGGLISDGGGQSGSPGAPTPGAPPINMAASTPAPATSLAPDPPGNLSGYVFLEPTTGSPDFSPTDTPSGETPLAGVAVTLNGPGGTQTSVTATSGAFSFSDLTPGVYSLSITAPTGDTSALAIASGGNGTAGTGTISDITIGSGQNQANENFAVTAGSQFEQVAFTASALVSGVQIPLAPFEQVISPVPKPNVPQQFTAPVMTPVMPGMIIPAIGTRPFRLGGSGGDSGISGANPPSPVYADNLLDEIWPAFGNRPTDNWLNEGPEQDMLQRLSNLGDVNLLNQGGTQNFTPAAPDSNRLDDLFDLNERWIDDRDVLPDSAPSQTAPLQSGTRYDDGMHATQAVLLDPVAAASPTESRLSSEVDGSPGLSVAVGAVAGWMLVSGKRGAGGGGRIRDFERRQRR